MPGGHDPSGHATADRPAIGRLTKRAEFLAAATGRRFHTERVTVQGRRRDPSASDEGLRVGLTLTKRVGHATERNRIRRRLRAAIRDAGTAFADVPLDIVLVGRRNALSAGFPQLVDDLRRALPVVLRPKSPSAPSRAGRGVTSPGATGGPHGSHIGPEPAGAGHPHFPSRPRDATRSRTKPRHD